MTQQLIEIGRRLKALRSIMDMTAEQMAEALNVCTEEYLAYEQGQRDFSFSFLYNAAGILGADVVDVISGESPRLTTCAVVRGGEGFHIARPDAYDYKHLAFTFSGKKAEPFMVTMDPANDIPEGGAATLSVHSHKGQEFVYMVSGVMEFHIGDVTHELREGDSAYFDAGLPHTMKPLGDAPAKFLSVVVK